ncbi:hypothetical protein TWF192_003675 [Orbilia oligospora]|uniref:Uncharacterized protein n=1 Tax=Orbilia oligospora TaxID=2813651 RepID=A0A6G1LRI0_ORBOL|nr:hypothetical protein TWF679_006663 [Orbilia oligospora]KAF3231204.1 hypothetical protein TWF192_003675 [Orbilia oligospora]
MSQTQKEASKKAMSIKEILNPLPNPADKRNPDLPRCKHCRSTAISNLTFLCLNCKEFTIPESKD